MEQSAIFNFLTANYELPVMQGATPVAAGYLSRNWIITTNAGRYFLKQYRFDDRTRVMAAHASLFHFHRAGIPAIVPISTFDGQPISEAAGRYYSLFPFVDGQQLRRGRLSANAVRSVGAMLARLHRAGDNVQPPHVRKRIPKDDRATFQPQATAILEQIAHQPTHGKFDRLAGETVHRQLALVEKTAMDYGALALQSEHLLHGDYHDGNLFFNAQAEVTSVFDWEKTEIAPRESELVRALLFTCFSNPNDFRGTFIRRNFELGAHFLTTYHAIYPVSQVRLIDALRARYWGSLCSLWVVTEHYLHNNARVDAFLEANLAEINYFADHLASFVGWLEATIEKRYNQQVS